MHERIEARERPPAHGFGVTDGLQDAAHVALRALDLRRSVGSRQATAARAPGCGNGLELVDEQSRAAVVDGDGLDDRHAEFLLEPRAVEPVAAVAREVAHVERDDHRHAEVAQFEHQAQVEPQVGRVHHAHHEFRRGSSASRPSRKSRVIASSSVVGVRL